MSSYEIRVGAELRAVDDGDRPRIEGTAIVFDRESADLGGFTEIMERDSITFDGDLVADFDHQSQYILGRQSNGTLEVRTDGDGVHFTAYPPDTQWARDLMVSMREGYIRQCSFAFRCLRDKWEHEGEKVVRKVKEALVSNLSIVAQPAYPQTSAEARSKAIGFRELLTAEDAGRELGDDDDAVREVAEPEAVEQDKTDDTGRYTPAIL